MSMALSGALQGAVYAHLVADTTLGALVAGRIYDAPLPTGTSVPAGPFVTLGEEVAQPFNTATSAGAKHLFTVSVHSAASGFSEAKEVAAALSLALVDAPLSLAAAGGHLVALEFVSARAKRGVAPELRRIDMRFRAVVELI